VINIPGKNYSSKIKGGKYSQSGAKSADSKLSVPKRQSAGKPLDRYAKKGFGGLRKIKK